MSEPSMFTTQDITLSTFLIVGNHATQEVRRNGAGKSDFIFLDSQKLRADVADFYACKARVEPQHFQSILRSLKEVSRFGYQAPGRQEQRSVEPDGRPAYR